MNRKYLGIAIIVIGVLLLAGIIYVLFFYNFNEPVPAPEPEAPASQATSSLDETKSADQPKVIRAKPTPKKQDVTKEDLMRMASLFAERFGSFSNQSNYQNIQDLKVFMSRKMGGWADDFVKKQIEKKADTSIYYGITTKAIAPVVEQYDEDAGKARITVQTQRREATATTGNTSSFSQSLTVSFVKEAGMWKVDEAIWQGKK